MQLRLFEADVHNSMEGLRRDVPAISAIAAAAATAANSNSTQNSADASSGTPQSIPTPQSPTSSTASSSDLSWISDPRQAPSIQALEKVNASCTAVLPKVEEVLNKGGELIRIFESFGVNFPAGKIWLEILNNNNTVRLFENK